MTDQPSMLAKGKAVEQKIRIVVHNADGSVKEDRGLVGYWSKNKFKMALWHICKHFRWSRNLFS